MCESFGAGRGPDEEDGVAFVQLGIGVGVPPRITAVLEGGDGHAVGDAKPGVTEPFASERRRHRGLDDGVPGFDPSEIDRPSGVTTSTDLYTSN